MLTASPAAGRAPRGFADERHGGKPTARVGGSDPRSKWSAEAVGTVEQVIAQALARSLLPTERTPHAQSNPRGPQTLRRRAGRARPLPPRAARGVPVPR